MIECHFQFLACDTILCCTLNDVSGTNYFAGLLTSNIISTVYACVCVDMCLHACARASARSWLSCGLHVWLDSARLAGIIGCFLCAHVAGEACWWGPSVVV